MKLSAIQVKFETSKWTIVNKVDTKKENKKEKVKF